MSDFLGKGWAFPLELDGDGGMVRVAGDERVRQSIHLILATAPGERLLRPQFGCEIHDLVFAPRHAETAGLAAAHVREALELWEPRIEVLDVRVEEGDEPTLLLVHVDYRVRATDSRFNLVHPFYLE